MLLSPTANPALGPAGHQINQIAFFSPFFPNFSLEKIFKNSAWILTGFFHSLGPLGALIFDLLGIIFRYFFRPHFRHRFWMDFWWILGPFLIIFLILFCIVSDFHDFLENGTTMVRELDFYGFNIMIFHDFLIFFSTFFDIDFCIDFWSIFWWILAPFWTLLGSF